jgi:hypothetical protein
MGEQDVLQDAPGQAIVLDNGKYKNLLVLTDPGPLNPLEQPERFTGD